MVTGRLGHGLLARGCHLGLVLLVLVSPCLVGVMGLGTLGRGQAVRASSCPWSSASPGVLAHWASCPSWVGHGRAALLGLLLVVARLLLVVRAILGSICIWLSGAGISRWGAPSVGWRSRGHLWLGVRLEGLGSPSWGAFGEVCFFVCGPSSSALLGASWLPDCHSCSGPSA